VEKIDTGTAVKPFDGSMIRGYKAVQVFGREKLPNEISAEFEEKTSKDRKPVPLSVPEGSRQKDFKYGEVGILTNHDANNLLQALCDEIKEVLEVYPETVSAVRSHLKDILK